MEGAGQAGWELASDLSNKRDLANNAVQRLELGEVFNPSQFSILLNPLDVRWAKLVEEILGEPSYRVPIRRRSYWRWRRSASMVRRRNSGGRTSAYCALRSDRRMALA
jgi:hypothetical protein